MIILRQNQRVFLACHFVYESVGEFLIYGAIMLPVLGAEQRARMGNVTKRPKSFISEAEIKPFFFLAGKPDPAKSILGMVGRYA